MNFGDKTMPDTHAFINNFLSKIKKKCKIEGSQAIAKQTAKLLRSVILQTRVPYMNQAAALIDSVKAVGERLIAANPVELADGAFFEILNASQEAIVLPPWVALAVRPKPGGWEYIRVNVHALIVEELTIAEYLHFKEELIDGSANRNFVLELNFEPFNASFPRPTLSKSIDNGVEFFNRHLSAKLFHHKESMQPCL